VNPEPLNLEPLNRYEKVYLYALAARGKKKYTTGKVCQDLRISSLTFFII
jgi:hypothetical protein